MRDIIHVDSTGVTSSTYGWTMTGSGPATEPRLTKGERTRRTMLAAAVEILDESGPGALTLQAIGERVGLHPTAIYRHFDRRDALLSATMEHLIAEVAGRLTLPDDPRGRITAIALEMRAMFHRHPGASSVFVTTQGSYESASAIERLVLASLRSMGLPENSLPVAYRALESLAIGASLFDFASAPHHLESRRQRQLSIGDPSLDRVSESPAQVDAVNEAAFAWALDSLLSRIAALGKV